jgi:NAD(P)H-hydrate epimerase
MLGKEEGEDHLEMLAEIEKYDAIGIGPGIGLEEQTARMVKLLLQSDTDSLVLDADALNILSENKTWMGFLPGNCILTPHPREFERLFGKTADDFERLELLRTSAIKYGVCIVLKGRYSLIASPGGNIFINTTGNPGMATGGSGDVLTGILTGLLAQGLSPLNACMAGVALHGLAGDLALEHESEQSLIASDLVKYLGRAFQEVAKFSTPAEL